jgi:hypothetical protein
VTTDELAMNPMANLAMEAIVCSEPSSITWLGKWMYNPTTHVQVSIDTDLSSYYFKKKIR